MKIRDLSLFFKALVLILNLGVGAVAWAVQPDEILSDPALEARARSLSQELRCLVCRNENIDESHAELARDLRVLVRERLQEGDSDTEALAFITARYGEYVLLMPRATGANWVLYLAGPLMLIIGAGLAFLFVRRRSVAPDEAPLSVQDQAQLAGILAQAQKSELKDPPQ
ncbi:MAG: cytochrome c-type biogenesis protein CcmH [Paracoccaceae bacterium]|jgi:cytochrome c-type biogenesis protein CcmH|nr:cytochrome c-type biogenesis protein CcmH [Paracoccaceae bacterium]MDP5350710.1 cytochrome c-type biogenesis protein CcmH [Paracoccaceae bacterium]MDP5354637.1 cytochrome c-type biogenesis protein CcmH [Paracoccaceae bacterium]MDP5356113.1 cytochrome c-type biogenesis protein CcmH [Paracoccaceae bacterium]